MSGATWARLADLPLRIDGYELEGHAFEPNPEFLRRTTDIHLHGAGETGIGEDVVYDPDEHEAAQAAGPVLPLAGDWTLASFSDHLATLALFPKPPEYTAHQAYRTWAYESAALDLALRQAGTSLQAALGREVRPLTFVNSMRLGEPPTLDSLRRRLDLYPGLRLKLDATSSWDDAIFAALVATGAVDSIDLKGQYVGTIVDQPPDPELYRRVVEAFPDAWIEDPKLDATTEPILAGVHDRITWDAPIHTVADVEALAFPVKMVNVKPSRSGPLRELFALYDHCAAHGIGAYGGGQTELSVGRGHIQLLAAIFHPDTPNDVAPIGYNDPNPAPGLPSSPLVCEPTPTGFRLAGYGSNG
jgi:L-alanine-DL-glutamate epimerase-like enolase superfamily enzyme